MFSEKKAFRFLTLWVILACTINLVTCRSIQHPRSVGDSGGNLPLSIIYNAEKVGIKNQIQMNQLFKDPTIKFVVLDFWATWGKPYCEDIPKLNEVYQQYRKKGLLLFGISIDDYKMPKEEIINFLRMMKNKDGTPANISYPILRDKNHALKKFYGCNSIPLQIVINKNNKIVFSNSGMTENIIQELNNKLKELLP